MGINFEDETFDVCRYEIYTIVKDIKRTFIATNHLDAAKDYYKEVIKRLNSSEIEAFQVGLYDCDINANLEHYDSIEDTLS